MFSFSITKRRPDLDTAAQCWIPSMILAPRTSAVDQATCFFFDNYGSSADMLDTCGNFQYLPEIFMTQQIGFPLQQAIAAVGFAGLANFWSASTIMAKANSTYCVALKSVNAALRCPEEAKSDQILATILLLGLWEVWFKFPNTII